MKKPSFVYQAAAFALALGAIVGCGRASDNLSANGIGNPLNGNCPAGSAATPWGCQPNSFGGNGYGWNGNFGCPSPYQPIGNGDVCKATFQGSFSVGSLNLFGGSNTYGVDLGRYYLDGDKIEVSTANMNGDFTTTFYAGSNSAQVPNNGSTVVLSVTGAGTNPTGYLAQSYVMVSQSSSAFTIRSGTVKAKATLCRYRANGQSLACPL
jgi:hypothetical protein